MVDARRAEGCCPRTRSSIRLRLGGRAVTRAPVPVRDDLRALEGYHSPQVDGAGPAQHQRVARAAARRRGATRSRPSCPASSGTATPTAPRPSCARRSPRSTASTPEQVFAANGSNEVLQTLLLTYAGPGRTRRDVRADLPAARPHRPAHRRRRWSRASAPPTSPLDLAEVAGVLARRRRRSITFLCSPNNPTGLVEPRGDGARRCSTVAPGLLVVDEAYGQFAPWSALDLVDDERPLVVTRTFSKTWSMAGRPARLPRRPGVAGRRARQGGAAVPPRRGQADRRSPRPAASSTRWRRG